MYQVFILPKAFEDLSKIDKTISKRITDKLAWLSENIEAIMPLPFGGEYSGFYKLRIGDWRVIYDIDRDAKVITIHKAGHRREIYE